MKILKELAWVDSLRSKFTKGKGVLTGIGDDCAVVCLGQERVLLKSDLFIENIHFSLKKITYKSIGMRAVARVLSDFAASGGNPEYIGISIGVPSYIKKQNLEKILEGVLTLSKKYNFSLVGGDTSKSEELFLDVWGVAKVNKPILRSKAKVGDYIFISGPLGARKFNTSFEPRIKESGYLAKNFKINSMIDISDGFAIDLYRILKESNKGALIDYDKLPLKKGRDDLYRGEDYELIFTIDKSDKKIEFLKKRFFYVGKITSKKQGYKIKINKSIKTLKPKGYSNF